MINLDVLEASEAGIALGFNDGEQSVAFALILRTLERFTQLPDSPVLIRQANFVGEGYPPPLEFVFATIPAAVARFAAYLNPDWREFRWTTALGSAVWQFGLLAEDGSGIWFGPPELDLALTERLLKELAHTAESDGIGLNWPVHVRPPN